MRNLTFFGHESNFSQKKGVSHVLCLLNLNFMQKIRTMQGANPEKKTSEMGGRTNRRTDRAEFIESSGRARGPKNK